MGSWRQPGRGEQDGDSPQAGGKSPWWQEKPGKNRGLGEITPGWGGCTPNSAPLDEPSCWEKGKSWEILNIDIPTARAKPSTQKGAFPWGKGHKAAPCRGSRR